MPAFNLINMGKLFLMLSLAGLLFSCTTTTSPSETGSSYPEAVIFTDSDIPDTNSLIGERLPFPELFEPLTIVQQDGFIYLVNSDRAKNRISAYTSEGKWLRDFLSRGRGPGEVLGGRYLYFSALNNELVYTDFKQRKVLLYDTDSLRNSLNQIVNSPDLAAITIRPQHEIRLGDTPCWRSFPSRNEVFSLVLASDDAPLIVTNDKTGQVVRSFGAYPELAEPVGVQYLSQIFQCNAVVDSAVSRMAILYQSTDLIDIYDLKTGKRLHRRHGPSLFYPKFRCEQKGNAYPAFSINGETRDAYFVCVERGGLIWASYSGNAVSDKVQKIPYIYAFDWDGNPVMKLRLDQRILSFDVDPEHRQIYVLSYEDGLSYVYRYAY